MPSFIHGTHFDLRHLVPLPGPVSKARLLFSRFQEAIARIS